MDRMDRRETMVGTKDVTVKRRHCKSPYASRIELIQARAEVLVGSDKSLIQMYLKTGSTFRQMARIAGVNEATISRRIHKLTRRLLDSEYITCIRNREMLSKNDLQIAKDYFIEGLAQNKIARKRDTSVYRVRKCLKKIQQLVTVTDSEQGIST